LSPQLAARVRTEEPCHTDHGSTSSAEEV